MSCKLHIAGLGSGSTAWMRELMDPAYLAVHMDSRTRLGGLLDENLSGGTQLGSPSEWGGRLDGVLTKNRGTFDQDLSCSDNPSRRGGSGNYIRPMMEGGSFDEAISGGNDLLRRGGSITRGGIFDQDVAARVNMLESFYYIAEWQTRNLHRFKSFMLDSGAFTFVFGSKKQVDIDDYIDRYIEYINENKVDLFFEMDIDAIVGYEKVKEIRRYIENKTGKQVIPVFHLERGKDEWLRMCDEYDYVAIGGIAVAKGRNKLEPYIPWFTSEAHKRGAKVHGLGYTNLTNLPNTGFDSVDSSAWLYGNRGGYIYRWDGRKMQKVNPPKGKKLDSKAAARHNFMEWVKMGEQLER